MRVFAILHYRPTFLSTSTNLASIQSVCDTFLSAVDRKEVLTRLEMLHEYLRLDIGVKTD